MAEQQSQQAARGEGPERLLEQQILQLKKQHQLQHQILLQHFQQQQQHLAEQHERQLRQHLKEFWDQQKQLQAIREREQLEALRRKEKHEQSAVASSEVKQKLQDFLRQRISGCGTLRPPQRPENSWTERMDTGSSENVAGSDFPLRKTASEPNLLKVRLKQRVMERRCSPMSKRHLPPTLKKKLLSSCPPPNGSPPQEPPKELSPPCGDMADECLRLPLFSSPSMPNISLAAHHVLAPDNISEAAVRAACTARLGMPLTGQMLSGTLPFYPSLPAIEAEHEDTPLDTISELQEPQPRGVIRPLGRTQSSPLPLGHPLLDGSAVGAIPTTVCIPNVPPPPTPEEIEETVDVEVMSDGGGPRSCSSSPKGFQLSEHSAFTPIRPLTRAVSSPVVHLGSPIIMPPALTRRRTTSGPTTGLAFDSQMLKHSCICGNNALHPEHAGRLQSIWARLLETGLVQRCDRLRPRKASTQEIQSCHSEAHALLYGTSPMNRHKMDVSKLGPLPVTAFVRLPCGGIGVDSDTTWNEMHTAPAARMAVGCTVDLAFRTWTGDIRNGFAIVRPPGHHAEPQQAMGFCFFNSVAIAARLLQKEHRVHKILIFDWDVHHGNGTQEIFYDDPRVLVISIHRHDDGNFFPGTGSPSESGAGAGLGFNINVGWSGGLSPPLGDAEYLAAFRSVVMPVAREFGPDIVLVSAGFDATDGHAPPLGGYRVSAACYGYMTRHLMQLANGKVVMALEGGYDLPSICDSAEECVRVLLGDPPSPMMGSELSRPPCGNAVVTLQKVIGAQAMHWPCLQEASKNVVCSHNEAMRSEKEDKETVTAMASLSMQQNSVLVSYPRPDTRHS